MAGELLLGWNLVNVLAMLCQVPAIGKEVVLLEARWQEAEELRRFPSDGGVANVELEENVAIW